VYPTIVDAIDCILKLSEFAENKENDKHEITFEEMNVAYIEDLKDKRSKSIKIKSKRYEIEDEDLDYYRKQSLTIVKE